MLITGFGCLTIGDKKYICGTVAIWDAPLSNNELLEYLRSEYASDGWDMRNAPVAFTYARGAKQIALLGPVTTGKLQKAYKASQLKFLFEGKFHVLEVHVEVPGWYLDWTGDEGNAFIIMRVMAGGEFISRTARQDIASLEDVENSSDVSRVGVAYRNPYARLPSWRYLFHRKRRRRLFRYVSENKLSQLESGRRTLTAVGLSGAGLGLQMSGQATTSLDARIERLVRQLRKERQVVKVGALKGQNFVWGVGMFGEYIIEGVVIWVSKLRDRPGLLLLGGSSANMHQNALTGTPAMQALGGSNPSTYLAASTALWRSMHADGPTGYVSSDDPAQESIIRTVEYERSRIFDGVPYTTIGHRAMRECYAAAKWSDAHAETINNYLEYLAIVHIDYTFDSDDHYPSKSDVLGRYYQPGERFVLGSPVYVAQLFPSMNTSFAVRWSLP